MNWCRKITFSLWRCIAEWRFQNFIISICCNVARPSLPLHWYQISLVRFCNVWDAESDVSKTCEFMLIRWFLTLSEVLSIKEKPKLTSLNFPNHSFRATNRITVSPTHHFLKIALFPHVHENAHFTLICGVALHLFIAVFAIVCNFFAISLYCSFCNFFI